MGTGLPGKPVDMETEFPHVDEFSIAQWLETMDPQQQQQQQIPSSITTTTMPITNQSSRFHELNGNNGDLLMTRGDPMIGSFINNSITNNDFEPTL